MDMVAERIIAGLKAAFEEKSAQAIVLRINSPGGSPVQAGIVNDEIKRLKAKHGKKVYAVVEEICASGAYYIAVAADEIYVDKASLVGSIGVLMDGFGFTGTMEKLGVERRLLTAGENKGMLDPFSPQNEQHRAFAKAMIDQIHQQFIAVVKDGRGDTMLAPGRGDPLAVHPPGPPSGRRVRDRLRARVGGHGEIVTPMCYVRYLVGVGHPDLVVHVPPRNGDGGRPGGRPPSA